MKVKRFFQTSLLALTVMPLLVTGAVPGEVTDADVVTTTQVETTTTSVEPTLPQVHTTANPVETTANPVETTPAVNPTRKPVLNPVDYSCIKSRPQQMCNLQLIYPDPVGPLPCHVTIKGQEFVRPPHPSLYVSTSLRPNKTLMYGYNSLNGQVVWLLEAEIDVTCYLKIKKVFRFVPENEITPLTFVLFEFNDRSFSGIRDLSLCELISKYALGEPLAATDVNVNMRNIDKLVSERGRELGCPAPSSSFGRITDDRLLTFFLFLLNLHFCWSFVDTRF
ncbi:uncharacterized protein LOC131953707 isoform X2 [Physella acuta]|uniref:uncharacterized protein LOC131953707 isoform X2 n=1 Tax=Physella acuta TaxID=109671 RepID=UPI0027DBBDFB|nr:uncharacterized protein LOC131953707 isoform X2 [Physella acuta]